MNAISPIAEHALSRQEALHERISAAAANKLVEGIQNWPSHLTLAVLRELGSCLSWSSASDAAYDAADRLEADLRSEGVRLHGGRL